MKLATSLSFFTCFKKRCHHQIIRAYIINLVISFDIIYSNQTLLFNDTSVRFFFSCFLCSSHDVQFCFVRRLSSLNYLLRFIIALLPHTAVLLCIAHQPPIWTIRRRFKWDEFILSRMILEIFCFWRLWCICTTKLIHELLQCGYGLSSSAALFVCLMI